VPGTSHIFENLSQNNWLILRMHLSWGRSKSWSSTATVKLEMHAMPLTATDTLYATPFPTYEELEQFVLYDLPERNPQRRLPTMMWNAELGETQHALLKRIFDSRVDPAAVREAGNTINELGGMDAMRANFYIYCHFIGERLKDMGLTFEQFAELHQVNARKIEFLWDGIGEWLM